MVQKQSWDGLITRWYEKELGLRGGYSRRLNADIPSSIPNSQYIISTDYGLKIVAVSGRLLEHPKLLDEPHYSHPYGYPKLKTSSEKEIITRLYRKYKKAQER